MEIYGKKKNVRGFLEKVIQLYEDKKPLKIKESKRKRKGIVPCHWNKNDEAV